MGLPLELLLLGLATILRRNAGKPVVKAKLADRARVVQIRTQIGDVGRYFVFCGGAVFSRRGVVSNADVSLVWKNAAVAARALRNASPDTISEALANGSLSIVGKWRSPIGLVSLCAWREAATTLHKRRNRQYQSSAWVAWAPASPAACSRRAFP